MIDEKEKLTRAPGRSRKIKLGEIELH